MLITKRSIFTHDLNTMDIPITPEELIECQRKWEDGTLIQEAYSQLNADQREFLMTGATPEEWDKIFRKMEIVDNLEDGPLVEIAALGDHDYDEPAF